PFKPDSPDRRVAGFNPYTQPKLDSASAPDPSQLCEPLLRGDREPDGLELVVCDGERIVEEHHHPVAREVLQRPFVPRHQLAERGVVLPPDVEQLLGSRRLAEGGEATQLREETRNVR